MVHYDDSRVRQIAKVLLDKKIKYLDPNVDGVKILSLPVRKILERDMMKEYLFNVVAPLNDQSHDLRQELFGFGSQHIDRDFGELRHALRLAEVGLCDPEALRRGKETLERLIRGVAQVESEAKESIAPEEATIQALNKRAMKRLPKEIQRTFREGGISGDPEEEMAELKQIWKRLQYNTIKTDINNITPNEIDAMQADGLYAFQQARHHRLVLAEMLDAVKEINRELDKNGPDRDKSDLSR